MSETRPTRVAVVGSTGSIGKQTLEVVERHPGRFRIVALAAGRNVDELEQQVRRHRPEVVALYDRIAADQLRERLSSSSGGSPAEVLTGADGLKTVACWSSADVSLIAVVGAVGIEPTIAAVRARKRVALANKETLVAAGPIVMEEVRRNEAELIPVDSEHSAVYQCLLAGRRQDVRSIILTASGGPFRNSSPESLARVTPSQALRHPNWSMGGKITIDSATLMNKGLEVIEAHWLFGVEYDKIEVIVHPQSIIHSMVEFVDGAVMAQMGVPDMKIPIQYALGYGERLAGGERLSLEKLGSLSFEPPDDRRFPALGIARRAGRIGGTMPAVMNAANEVAANAFLDGRIRFVDIPAIVERVMDDHETISNPDLDSVLEADRRARKLASVLLGR